MLSYECLIKAFNKAFPLSDYFYAWKRTSKNQVQKNGEQISKCNVFLTFFLLTTCSRTSSGTFLDTLVTFLAEEWEKMSGDLVTFRASLMVLDETWLMSTIMPNLFISLTIISPNPDKPLFKTGSLPPSASEESALSSEVSS